MQTRLLYLAESMRQVRKFNYKHHLILSVSKNRHFTIKKASKFQGIKKAPVSGALAENSNFLSGIFKVFARIICGGTQLLLDTKQLVIFCYPVGPAC
jgi:hypothetical protein